MQRVIELKNTGTGKTCLIIGGGRSVLSFDFNKNKFDVVIGCNESGYNVANMFKIKIDYSIYYDLGAVQEISKFPKIPDHKLICSNNNLDKRADYDFRLKEIGCEQSDNIGKKALVIAHDIMNFDKIYLIGFDFYTEIIDGQEISHFFGDHTGKGKKYCEEQCKQDHFKRLNDMIGQFDIVSHYENVFNLNKDSNLKCYPFEEK